MTPTCPEPAQLEAFIGGALDSQRAEVVGAHVATCASCASFAWPSLSRTHAPSAGEGAAREVSTEHYLPLRGEGGLEVELGRGGIGRVLLVTDAHLGRDVAMKVLLAKRLDDPDLVHGIEQRFVREARVTGQLEHPAIVPVYEMGRRADGSLYYVMRRIRGRTLASAVEAAENLEERLKLLPRVLAVCQAIAFAHSRHVVHRDLKPQNVMLDRFGETYVVDWGLASVRGQGDEPRTGHPAALDEDAMRLTPELTLGVEHLVIGTPAYMSPEQASGDISQVDELSDVFGLGAILFEVITGKLPRRSFDAPIRPVLEVEPAAPPELAAICAKALAPDRSQRYASAEALAVDLDAWVHGHRVEAYAYGPLELLRRFTSQYRAPLAVALLAALSLAGLGLTSWRRVRFERDEARELAQLVFGDLGRQLMPVPGSGPIVDSVTRRAVTFYERVLQEQDVPLAERESMAAAVLRLAELNVSLGRTAETTRLGALCNQLTSPVEGVTRTRQLFLVTAINCELVLATVAFRQGKSSESEVHLAEAERRVALGSPEWAEPEWLRVQSGVYSRRFQVAWAAGDTGAAKQWAEKEVALDERVFALVPDRIEAAEGLASALGDLSMVLLGTDDAAGGLAAGARSIELLRGVKDLSNNVSALTRLAGSLSQHSHALALLQGDAAKVKALQREGLETFERLLHLEPGRVDARYDYGVLLLRAGEGQRAFDLFLHLDDAEAINELAMAALIAAQPQEVVSRRAAIEARAEHRGLWVLALALAATGDPHGGAALAREAAREAEPIVEWPSAAMHAYAARFSGPAAVVLERFVREYDEAATNDATRGAVLEHLATGLEALPAAQ